jgi:hypothetical protein
MSWLREYDTEEYGERLEPEPAVTTSREARVQLLAERARRGEALFVAGDVVRMPRAGVLRWLAERPMKVPLPLDAL